MIIGLVTSQTSPQKTWNLMKEKKEPNKNPPSYRIEKLELQLQIIVRSQMFIAIASLVELELCCF